MDSYIENILQKGVAAHAQGRLQAAKRLYHRVLKSYPRQPDANHNLRDGRSCKIKLSTTLQSIG